MAQQTTPLLGIEAVDTDPAAVQPHRGSCPGPRPEESSITDATQQSLMTLEWLGRHDNSALAGPSGTGKPHLVEALGHAAIEKDMRVAWFTLER
jgi:hypothetical protein